MTVEANPSDSARSLLGRYPLGWACVSSAALATAVDAALLQKGKSYFTGGFLAPDSAVRVADMIGFFIASFGADMAVSLVNEGPVTFMLRVPPATSPA